MITHKLTVVDSRGIHATVAAKISTFANATNSSIFLRAKGEIVNAIDIVSILGLIIRSGEEMEILIDGPNEIADMNSLLKLIINDK